MQFSTATLTTWKDGRSNFRMLPITARCIEHAANKALKEARRENHGAEPKGLRVWRAEGRASRPATSKSASLNTGAKPTRKNK